jgi:hypothetical protein
MSLLIQLQIKVGQYSDTPNGKWLKEFDWSGVPVAFKDDLPGYIAGYYSFNGITLRKADVSSIFSIYVHELRHRWQWKKNPLKYIIGKLYRPLIENDADEHQKYADDWFNKMADDNWRVN